MIFLYCMDCGWVHGCVDGVKIFCKKCKRDCTMRESPLDVAPDHRLEWKLRVEQCYECQRMDYLCGEFYCVDTEE